MQCKCPNIYGDQIGYVERIQVMGDEFTPAEDARMSTGKGRLGPEKDAALQTRLMKDKHTSPFEGVVVKFDICCPLFVLRELDRHRTICKLADEEMVSPEESSRCWLSRNEMSGRYVKLPDQYYHPIFVRKQGNTSDTFSCVDGETKEEFLRRGAELTRGARELYDWAVEKGIERGLARTYNLQNQYTRIRLTGNLKNWLDFLALRCKPDVLWECRQVAEAIRYLLKYPFPSIVAQWEDNVLNAVVLSRREAEAVRKFIVAVEPDETSYDVELASFLNKVK